MKLRIRSLFLKIFLWFWATAIATALALIISFLFGPGSSVPMRWHSTLTSTARSSGMIAIAELERGGIPAASAYIERFERDTGLRACLFDHSGNTIAGFSCETFREVRFLAATRRKLDLRVRYGIVRVALILPGARNQDYIYATELPAGPRAAFGANVKTILIRLTIAFVVSGLICYLLVQYLTAPILRLKHASQLLASGNLSTRADRTMEARQDEFGDLVRDFNTMAGRLDELVSRQRQLIYDISHEFRSPLARMNVALDLGRQRKGTDPAFDRMERDIERLDGMIERLLTIARLDQANAGIELCPLGLNELVEHIVQDACFEAQKRGVSVELNAENICRVKGNGQLLHSAIENVIRNAVWYTEQGTTVEVALRCDEKIATLQIRDAGPGVPSADLEKIFQPFYRTSDARDRRSGGTGLGLAIADQVIRVHGGSIMATNAKPTGLLVTVTLPVADIHQSRAI